MLLVIERFFKQYITFPSSIIWNILKVVIVFSLISIGWLLFKLPDFYQAIEYIHSIMLNKGIIRKDVVLLILFYSLPVFVYYMNYIIRTKTRFNLADSNLIYALMLFFIITNKGPNSAFIYFQF